MADEEPDESKVWRVPKTYVVEIILRSCVPSESCLGEYSFTKIHRFSD